jgi:hypothetical protein
VSHSKGKTKTEGALRTGCGGEYLDYSGDEIKEDEVGGACSAHGRDVCVQNFGLKT